MGKNTRNYSSIIDENIKDDSINFLDKFQKIKNHVLRWGIKKKKIEAKIVPLNKELKKYADAIQKGEAYMSEVNAIVEQKLGSQTIETTDARSPKYSEPASQNELCCDNV